MIDDSFYFNPAVVIIYYSLNLTGAYSGQRCSLRTSCRAWIGKSYKGKSFILNAKKYGWKVSDLNVQEEGKRKCVLKPSCFSEMMNSPLNVHEVCKVIVQLLGQ